MYYHTVQYMQYSRSGEIDAEPSETTGAPEELSEEAPPEQESHDAQQQQQQDDLAAGDAPEAGGEPEEPMEADAGEPAAEVDRIRNDNSRYFYLCFVVPWKKVKYVCRWCAKNTKKYFICFLNWVYFFGHFPVTDQNVFEMTKKI